jgi:hypothetical protein
MSRCAPNPKSAPKSRPESAHFVQKGAILLCCSKSTVLTDVGRPMRARTVAAPLAAFYALGLRGRKPRESSPFAPCLRKFFPKIRIYVTLLIEADRKISARCKSANPWSADDRN